MGGLTIKVDDLKKDLIIIEWLETLNPKPHTERNYLASMQLFTEWIRKTPDELLCEAEDDIKAGKLMRQRSIKRYLTGFRKHLQDKGLAPITVKSHLTGVKSFYKLFDIELPTLPRLDKRARPLEKNNKIPTKEDLQTVLNVCDPLEKAVLLVGTSSGLSANEIVQLRVRDIKYDADLITTLYLVRGKTGTPFTTFLHPEATRAVLNYISFRNRTFKTARNAKSAHSEKQKIYSDSNFLFIRRHISDNFLKNKSEDERRLDVDALVKIYKYISDKAQKNTPKGDWALIRSHNARKYFNSALLNAGADSFFTEYLMGHQLDDTRAAYFRASPEKLKEIYKKYIPYLTIQKEGDITENPDFKRMSEEVQKLKGENEKLKLDRYENEAIKKLKEDIEELRRVQKEDEELENIFSYIAAGEFSELNQHEDWDTKYAEHERRMKTDAAYRKKYIEFEKPFIIETFSDVQGEEVQEYNRKKFVERRKLIDAENKLHKALMGIKTLADEL